MTQRNGRFALLGPPMSGKGTQARRLAVALGVPHISTGELFAEQIARGTELGRAVAGYVNRGDLVPDEIVFDVLAPALAHHDGVSGFVLDGFPRTAGQASELERLLTPSSLHAVAHLHVPESELLERLATRAAQQARSDDTTTTLRHRIAVFEREAAALTEFYRVRGLLTEIDGTGEVGRVAARIDEAVSAALGTAPAHQPARPLS